ncbi:MAG: outer membrane protein assembly factor BamD [Bacteriovoracaceae bacterium]|nr:outer membrane protein assembly factor BamD [Bacteriovoracaceae bacterium]
MLKHKCLSILFLLLFLIGCATERPVGKTEAEILYKEAKDLIADQRYLLATERLNTIRQQYPYSFYATHAELMQADILFMQENFVESAASYILFKDFHPKHKKLSYVLLRIADSFYYQLPDTYDRDLAPGHEAIKYYQELTRIFRKSKHVKEANKRIIEIKTMIRKKEQYIADFYYKTEVFDSARFRYLNILKTFKKKSLRDHSMIRVLESSASLEKPKECASFYRKYKRKVTSKNMEKLKSAYLSCKKL